jgi:hypothetical protein
VDGVDGWMGGWVDGWMGRGRPTCLPRVMKGNYFPEVALLSANP